MKNEAGAATASIRRSVFGAAVLAWILLFAPILPVQALPFGVHGEIDGVQGSGNHSHVLFGPIWADQALHSRNERFDEFETGFFLGTTITMATGQALLGSLAASADSLATVPVNCCNLDGSSASIGTTLKWQDELTITLGGTVRFTMTLDADLTATPPALTCGGFPGFGGPGTMPTNCAMAIARLGVGGAHGASLELVETTNGPVNPGILTTEIHVDAGDHLFVDGLLQVGAKACASTISGAENCHFITDRINLTSASSHYAVDASAAFFIDVFGGAAYTTASGQTYFTPQVTGAPEPGTALLLAGGILSLAGLRRRTSTFRLRA